MIEFRRIKVGLGTKFVLLVIGILTITLSIATAFVINSQNKLFQEQLNEKGRLLGGFVSLILPELILSYDFSSMEAYMKEVVSRNDMVYSVVVDNQNIAMTSYMDGEKLQIQSAMRLINTNKAEDILAALKKNKDIIHLSFPVNSGKEQLGHVLIGISRHRLEASANRVLLNQIFSDGIIIILLSLSIYLVFRYSAIRPIKSLIAGSTRIAQGNLDKSVEVYSEDELGSLSIAFNQMMLQLKESIAEKDVAMAELLELNATLEERVLQRTEKLEISEAQIRAIHNKVGEGIIVIDENGLISSFNPAAQGIFSGKDAELLGVHAIMLLADQSPEGLTHAFNADINTGHPFKTDEINHRTEVVGQRMDGTTFPMEMATTNIRLGDENMHACIVRDITQRKETEMRLIEAQNSIIAAAHKSGMAEIATGVLHNIGNILNSVNISVEEVSRITKNSKILGLNKAAAMLSKNIDNIGDFISNDSKGKKLPDYFIKLSNMIEEERELIMSETKALSNKTTMMKDVIITQQAYATGGFLTEEFQIFPLIEDAIKILESSLIKQHIIITKNFSETPNIAGQKSKLLQILTNLIKNAIEATFENDTHNKAKEIKLDVGIYNSKSVYISVTDNGAGIEEKNYSNIFNHGFTTKKNGHGFGLHSSANSMTEMGGTLTVSSNGTNTGSCFTISIPIADCDRRENIIDYEILPKSNIA